jgi:elongation factor Ts
LEVSVDLIKALRDETGAGIMDSKRALEQADGDLERARSLIREKGLSTAAKKADNVTNEGIVESYIHSGGRVGALVELNCQTDFVARTEDFKSLAHELAMQVAAMSPTYVDASEIPNDQDGVTPEQDCLLQQPYIRDNSQTIQDLVTEAVGRLGENVRVRRFSRFALGE